MKRIFSHFIFIFVSTAICYGGYFSLRLSFEKKSNFYRLSNLYKTKYGLEVVAINRLQQNTPPDLVLGSHFEISNKHPCTTTNNALLNKTNSIVDFLYYQNQDYSFTGRSELAKKYNIENYTGNASQNMLLLAILRQELEMCK